MLPSTLTREYGHDGRCVGCAAHCDVDCLALCPFRTGRFGTGVVLRAAAARLDERLFGCRVRDSIATAALRLGGGDARRMADAAVQALGAYLSGQASPGCALTGEELVAQLQLSLPAHQVTLLLYAAADHHEHCATGGRP
ncbi:hypothetical protein [Krasilnikovia sp. MM14-A1259]|uniref:hypothetical protein n=1 Tax=Krasilnikovia sp. MM14-A1259 TaxID=3373539 RepID=UPI00399D3CF9